ncbi:MAG TPA: dethiobiotin synthase, partial [Paralcaligenes sp.]
MGVAIGQTGIDRIGDPARQPQALTTPYLFRQATAPHIAAALENRPMSLPHILECYERIAERADAVVVEGVGGFCVPLNGSTDTADMARQLGLP